MIQLIQAATVLAAFAAAHERVIEAIRSVNDHLSATYRWWQRLGAWIDRHTIGPGNVVIAIGVAFATQANLLALFRTSTPTSQQAMFFDLFMKGDLFMKVDPPVAPSWMVFGYILMGLTTALGSQTWHDLAGGLIDLRQRMQAVSAQVVSQGVPAQPSTLFVVPTGGGANAPMPLAAPSGPRPPAAPPPGVFIGT